jgi:hypothetical protein
MNKSGQIEIPLSKLKMILLFIGAFLLVALGLYLIIFVEPESINYSSRHSWIMRPVPRFIAGLVCIIFFGFIGVTIFIKLFDRKPGIVINEKGIYDNSSGLSAGMISWSDIITINTVTVNKQKFLLIVVKNPKAYLKKTDNFLKYRAKKMNYKYYGTPICISANSLQIKFDELYKLLVEKMKEFKK